MTNQEEACRKRAEAEGWQVAEVYTDNDRGASSRSRKRRPEYEGLLNDARAGKFDVLVCYSTSRLTRRPLELEQWLALAETGCIRPVFLTGPVADWTSAQGRAVARTLAAWDAQEAETTGDRVAFRFAAQAAKGKRHGGVRAFGWDANGKLNQAEADAIKAATRRVIRGEVSILGLCREWHAMGLRPTRGGKWHTITVRRILMRPTNAGLAIYRREVLMGEDGNPVRGEWDRIVTVDEWEAVCAVLNSPERKPRTPNKTRNVVTNLAKCALCGSPMRTAGVGTTKNRYDVYRCSNVAGCGGLSISRKKVDDAVEQAIVADYLEEGESGQQAAQGVDAELAELTKRQGEVTSARDAILTLVSEKTLTVAQARGELRRLEATEAEIRDARQKLITSSAHAAMLVEARERLQALTRFGIEPGRKYKGLQEHDEAVDQLRTAWAALSLADKRALIEARLLITVRPVAEGPERVRVTSRTTGKVLVGAQRRFTLLPASEESA